MVIITFLSGLLGLAFAPAIFTWAIIGAITTLIIQGIFWRKFAWAEALLVAIVAWLISIISLPPLSPALAASWWFFGFILIGAVGIGFLTNKEEKFGAILIPIGFFFAFILYSVFSTWAIVRGDAYAKIIDVTDHGQVETQLDLIDQAKAPHVTYQLAQRRASELLGAQSGSIGSTTVVGTMWGNVTGDDHTSQWAAPLQHTKFRHWAGNVTTPGYAVVNMTNSTAAKIVNDHPIKIGTDGFYFTSDVKTFAYTQGFINFNYAEPFFQLDNEGKPFWVLPMTLPQIGFAAEWPVKWLVIDAETKAYNAYDDAEKLPKWIDRAYPQDLIAARFDDWGCYREGWSNCVFGRKDVIVHTPGTVVTIDNAGNMIYYTGTQFHTSTDGSSAKAASSGKLIVSARTGQADFYRAGGITEQTAVAVLQGAVSNYEGWTAQSPVLINVGGQETLYSVITDRSGSRKAYGFVSLASRDVLAVETDLDSAVRSYLRAVRTNLRQSAINGDIESIVTEIVGLVQVITPYIESGETTYFIRLEGDSNIYAATGLPEMGKIALSQAGETITLKVDESGGLPQIQILGFENPAFDPPIEPENHQQE